jgi:hypothetical protein
VVGFLVSLSCIWVCYSLVGDTGWGSGMFFLSTDDWVVGFIGGMLVVKLF